MNKTLLLIICDFLLLNLLALTRWEQAEPAPPANTPAVTTPPADAASTDADLVALMRLSMEDERAEREALAQQLDTTREELSTREQALAAEAAERARLERERAELTTNLTATQRAAEDLQARVEAAQRDTTMTRERLAQMQRDLEQQQAEATRRAEQVANLERAQSQAQERIVNLAAAVQVAEREKQILAETTDTLRVQVAAEREERLRVTESATQLAAGVGQLAEQSADLRQEIRDNRPINANVLFSDFLAARVTTQFTAARSGVFGPVTRNREARTVLVTDGQQTYALVHVADTPFNLRESATEWTTVRAELGVGARQVSAPELHFLAIDPRLVSIPVSAEQAATLGGKVYQLALDPFRFPEAVLISSGGRGYGEVPFKLDPTNPSYVQMDNRLVRRLFGDFSPSTGDLVLSKTGELLGIMVNGDYCVVVTNFLPAQRLPTGATVSGAATRQVLEAMAGRYNRLPLRLQ